jgi:hypothetical protein
MGYPPLQGDGAVVGLPRRLSGAVGVAAFPVANHLGAASQGADPANASYRSAVPNDDEFEVLIR